MMDDDLTRPPSPGESGTENDWESVGTPVMTCIKTDLPEMVPLDMGGSIRHKTETERYLSLQVPDRRQLSAQVQSMVLSPYVSRNGIQPMEPRWFENMMLVFQMDSTAIVDSIFNSLLGFNYYGTSSKYKKCPRIKRSHKLHLIAFHLFPKIEKELQLKLLERLEELFISNSGNMNTCIEEDILGLLLKRLFGDERWEMETFDKTVKERLFHLIITLASYTIKHAHLKSMFVPLISLNSRTQESRLNGLYAIDTMRAIIYHDGSSPTPRTFLSVIGDTEKASVITGAKRDFDFNDGFTFCCYVKVEADSYGDSDPRSPTSSSNSYLDDQNEQRNATLFSIRNETRENGIDIFLSGSLAHNNISRDLYIRVWLPEGNEIVKLASSVLCADHWHWFCVTISPPSYLWGSKMSAYVDMNLVHTSTMKYPMQDKGSFDFAFGGVESSQGYKWGFCGQVARLLLIADVLLEPDVLKLYDFHTQTKKDVKSTQEDRHFGNLNHDWQQLRENMKNSGGWSSLPSSLFSKVLFSWDATFCSSEYPHIFHDVRGTIGTSDGGQIVRRQVLSDILGSVGGIEIFLPLLLSNVGSPNSKPRSCSFNATIVARVVALASDLMSFEFCDRKDPSVGHFWIFKSSQFIQLLRPSILRSCRETISLEFCVALSSLVRVIADIVRFHVPDHGSTRNVSSNGQDTPLTDYESVENVRQTWFASSELLYTHSYELFFDFAIWQHASFPVHEYLFASMHDHLTIHWTDIKQIISIQYLLDSLFFYYDHQSDPRCCSTSAADLASCRIGILGILDVFVCGPRTNGTAFHAPYLLSPNENETLLDSIGLMYRISQQDVKSILNSCLANRNHPDTLEAIIQYVISLVSRAFTKRLVGILQYIENLGNLVPLWSLIGVSPGIRILILRLLHVYTQKTGNSYDPVADSTTSINGRFMLNAEFLEHLATFLRISAFEWTDECTECIISFMCDEELDFSGQVVSRDKSSIKYPLLFRTLFEILSHSSSKVRIHALSRVSKLLDDTEDPTIASQNRNLFTRVFGWQQLLLSMLLDGEPDSSIIEEKVLELYSLCVFHRMIGSTDFSHLQVAESKSLFSPPKRAGNTSKESYPVRLHALWNGLSHFYIVHRQNLCISLLWRLLARSVQVLRQAQAGVEAARVLILNSYQVLKQICLASVHKDDANKDEEVHLVRTTILFVTLLSRVLSTYGIPSASVQLPAINIPNSVSTINLSTIILERKYRQEYIRDAEIQNKFWLGLWTKYGDLLNPVSISGKVDSKDIKVLCDQFPMPIGGYVWSACETIVSALKSIMTSIKTLNTESIGYIELTKVILSHLATIETLLGEAGLFAGGDRSTYTLESSPPFQLKVFTHRKASTDIVESPRYSMSSPTLFNSPFIVASKPDPCSPMPLLSLPSPVHTPQRKSSNDAFVIIEEPDAPISFSDSERMVLLASILGDWLFETQDEPRESVSTVFGILNAKPSTKVESGISTGLKHLVTRICRQLTGHDIVRGAEAAALVRCQWLVPRVSRPPSMSGLKEYIEEQNNQYKSSLFLQHGARVKYLSDRINSRKVEMTRSCSRIEVGVQVFSLNYYEESTRRSSWKHDRLEMDSVGVNRWKRFLKNSCLSPINTFVTWVPAEFNGSLCKLISKVDRCENSLRMRLRLKQEYKGHRVQLFKVGNGQVVSSLTSLTKMAPPQKHPVPSEKPATSIASTDWDVVDLKSVHYAARNEKVVHSTECELVLPLCVVRGRMDITVTHIYFYGDFVSIPGDTEEQDVSSPVFERRQSDEDFENISELSPDSIYWDPSCQREELSAFILKPRRWALCDLCDIHRRRYLLQSSALEFFFLNRKNYLFNFPGYDENDIVFQRIIKQKPRLLSFGHMRNYTRNAISVVHKHAALSKLYKPQQLIELRKEEWTDKWVHCEMSTFEYLMNLNTAAGRTYNDLTQYPVFPWILTDYTSSSIDLHDPKVYRDLSKPIGALNPQRLDRFIKRKQSLESDENNVPPFLYGSHYSTIGSVLYYLMRLEPFTQFAKELQGGRFDHADRLFHSVEETWKNCLGSDSDVKELTPEWFYLGEMFLNQNDASFGKRQNGTVVDNVILPAWANDSVETFVRTNMEALESDVVSQSIHLWIDLIFGVKQRGLEAEKANNLFYYLTYEDAVDLESVKDPMLRRSIETQIAFFGQTPALLFSKPHPKRKPSRTHRLQVRNPFSVYCASRGAQNVSTIGIFGSQSCVNYSNILIEDEATGILRRLQSGSGWEHVSLFHVLWSDGSLRKYHCKSKGNETMLIQNEISKSQTYWSTVGKACRYANTIISCGHVDGTIKIHSLLDGKLVQNVELHRGSGIATVISVDESCSRIAVGCFDGTILVWNLVAVNIVEETVQSLQEEAKQTETDGSDSEEHNDHESSISGLLINKFFSAFRPKKIANTPILNNLSGPRHWLFGCHESPISNLYLSADLDIIISTSMNNPQMILHSASDGVFLRSINIDFKGFQSITVICVTRLGQIVAQSQSIDDGYQLHRFSINNGFISTVPYNHKVLKMYPFQNSKYVLLACNSYFEVLDVSTFGVVLRKDLDGSLVQDIKMGSDEMYIVVTHKDGSVSWHLIGEL